MYRQHVIQLLYLPKSIAVYYRIYKCKFELTILLLDV